MIARRLLGLVRWLDPTLIPVAGKCVAVTEGHEACPLWQLAEEKRRMKVGSL